MGIALVTLDPSATMLRAHAPNRVSSTLFALARRSVTGGARTRVSPALAAATAAAALLIAGPVAAQEPAAEVPDTAYVPGEYRVFTGGGEPSTLGDIVAAMATRDVVFVGETHDDPTGHHLEAELLARAWAAYAAPPESAGGVETAEAVEPGRDGDTAGRRDVALSLEFFERDVQRVVDEYLAGLITESAFRADSRPWPRYGTDYRPLVEFARQHGVDVVAANAPRRYVSRVTLHGRESLRELDPGALETLPPLPYGEPSAAYRNQWIRVMAAVMEEEGTKCGVPVSDPPAPVGSHHAMANQLQSQALWDATMAWWVHRYLEAHPGALVLHVVGGFHVARGTGIPEQLRAYRPDVRSMIVMLRPVEDVDAFEPAPEGEWGDFVIQTEAARTLEAIECRGVREEHGAGATPAPGAGRTGAGSLVREEAAP